MGITWLLLCHTVRIGTSGTNVKALIIWTKKKKLDFIYREKHKQKDRKTCRWASGHRPCNRKERPNRGRGESQKH